MGLAPNEQQEMISVLPVRDTRKWCLRMQSTGVCRVPIGEIGPSSGEMDQWGDGQLR